MTTGNVKSEAYKQLCQNYTPEKAKVKLYKEV